MSSFHHSLSFADRHLPPGVGQALQLPDVARQCGRVELEVIRWPEECPTGNGGHAHPTRQPPLQATTNRPRIVINGAEHPLTPGWNWPTRTENPT